MKKITIILLLLLTANFLNTGVAQHLFKEQFSGCVTDNFGLEMDSTDVDIEHSNIIKVVTDSLSKKEIKAVTGRLLLQVIVDTDGNPCLLSVENTTNFSSERLGLKHNIDTKLKCSKPTKKMSPIIIIMFKEGEIKVLRYGNGGDKGFHLLVE